VVGAEVLWQPALPANGAVRHAAECDTIDRTGMDAEADDPAPALIHDDPDSFRISFPPSDLSVIADESMGIAARLPPRGMGDLTRTKAEQTVSNSGSMISFDID
jgi:hypothetical protein